VAIAVFRRGSVPRDKEFPADFILGAPPARPQARLGADFGFYYPLGPGESLTWGFPLVPGA